MMWVVGVILIAAGAGSALAGPVGAIIAIGIALVSAGVMVDVWGET
jgi:hypothetical protein